MNLTFDHTYVRRVATLPASVIQRFLRYYGVSRYNDERMRYLIVQDMNQQFDTLFGKKGDLVTEWVLLNWDQGDLIWPEDSTRVQQALQIYYLNLDKEKYKKAILDHMDSEDYSKSEGSINLKQYKNLLSFNLTDIEFINDIYKAPEIDPRVNELQDKLPEGASLIYNNGVYQIVGVDSPQAACMLGRGTKWCTSDPDVALSYLRRSPLYVFYLNGKKIAQLHIEEFGIQFMDLRDRDLVVDGGLRKALIESGLMDKIAVQMSKRPNSISDQDVSRWFGDTPSSLIENFVYDKPVLAYLYADYILGKRFPRGEPAILTDPWMSYKYARYIIKGRWPEAEPGIIRDKRYLQEYIGFISTPITNQFKSFVKDNEIELRDYDL